MPNLNVGDLCTFQKFKGDVYWVRVTEVYLDRVHMESLYDPKIKFSTKVHNKVERIPQYVLNTIRDTLVS